ncbi:MAG: hypothetical protein Unbinned4311contig1001_3 [Prokaryotic dsDNA virus sp.]|nr:MAG: hypothetical protein Unbinned4311contig1001_3 [Prokaryotic dsDNA virus sp.]|tara:strand:+ start:402 stop:665 length:264 start_codon:yes stop_codon:yes gene_type:complete
MKQVNMNEDCQFLQDLQDNQKMAIWNLITSIGGVKLWTKGIKPNRHWKLSQVKTYFGLKGNAESVYEQLETLNKICRQAQETEKSND